MNANEVQGKKPHISALSIVAVIGFSLYAAWAILSCFWLLSSTQSSQGSFPMDAVQKLWIFVGFAAGFIALRFFGEIPKFNIFNIVILAAMALCTVLLPVLVVFTATFNNIPVWIPCIVYFISGLAGSAAQVCWLDVFSRFDMSKLALSIGMATLGGVIVFLLIVSMNVYMQAIATIICILVSIGLIGYSSVSAPHNAERAPLTSVQKKWEFTREIEPALMMLAFIFALSFFFVAGMEPIYLLVGMCGIALGAAATIVITLTIPGVVDITMVERVDVVIAVLACILMPFVPYVARAVLSVIIIGACSFLVNANSVFLIRKICSPRTVPVFKAIPQRLAVFATGFAIGWALAAVVAIVPDINIEVIGYIRLVAAVILVGIVMFFIPVQHHHRNDEHRQKDGQSKAVEPAKPTVQKVDSVQSQMSEKPQMSEARAAMFGVSAEGSASGTSSANASSPALTETEIFEMRCEAIVKLYQLSPREADILPYLAKGRNNAYLQEKFTISPHTAKSHIYNIYRKLDIHSQQKLMDFVEDFPLD